MDDNNFEKFPGGSVEDVGEREVSEEQDFAKAFEDGVPEFNGSTLDVVNETQTNLDQEIVDEETMEYNKGLTDAAALINYGLDAAARELGVEQVVQKIKSFNTSGSADPVKDLFEYLGVDTKTEHDDVAFEGKANKPNEEGFRDEFGVSSNNRSKEGAFNAIADMKELISEVEGADPRYAGLREGAKAAGMGYYEYAVKDYGARGLTELFRTLAQQKSRGNKLDDTETESAEKEEADRLAEGILGDKSVEDGEKEDKSKDDEEDKEKDKEEGPFGGERENLIEGEQKIA